MNKILLILAAAVLSANVFAQDLLKYNYKNNGYVFTAAERIRVEGSTPLMLKLERVIFPDNGKVYKLHIDVEDKSPWKMPKNAPVTIVTSSGKTIVVKNSNEEPNLIAPQGISTSNGKVYWNFGEYYFEEADIKKMLSGVSSVDITRRWSSDGYIKLQYKDNEFGAAVAKAYGAIENAPEPKMELGKLLKFVNEQAGNRIIETDVLRVNGEIALSMAYLYYGSSNNESYDLNIFLNKKNVPLGAPVLITTASGETISLKQEKELSGGRVLCYPTLEQVKAMGKGVTRIVLDTDSGSFNAVFKDEAFGSAVDRLYNAVQTAAIL